MDEKAVSGVKVLSELDKKVISKRLDALRADYPVSAARILFADGSEWKVGDFPQPQATSKQAKSKRSRKYVEGYVIGTMARLGMPWIELAAENPGEEVRVRLSDFPSELGLTAPRLQGAMSAQAANKYGKGSFTVFVRKQPDGDDMLIIKKLLPVRAPQLPQPDFFSKAVQEIADEDRACNGVDNIHKQQATGNQWTDPAYGPRNN